MNNLLKFDNSWVKQRQIRIKSKLNCTLIHCRVFTHDTTLFTAITLQCAVTSLTPSLSIVQPSAAELMQLPGISSSVQRVCAETGYMQQLCAFDEAITESKLTHTD